MMKYFNYIDVTKCHGRLTSGFKSEVNPIRTGGGLPIFHILSVGLVFAVNENKGKKVNRIKKEKEDKGLLNPFKQRLTQRFVQSKLKRDTHTEQYHTRQTHTE